MRIRARSWSWSWSLIPLLLLSCRPDFTPASLVENLRILAVRSDPAAARPGERVTLYPLIVDPRGGGRSLTFEWAACVTFDGGMPQVVLPRDCAIAESGLPILGTDLMLAYEIPPEVAELAELPGLTDATGTFALPLRFTVRAGAETRRAIVSVSIVFTGLPNRNPALLGIQTAGMPLPSDPPLVVRVGEEIPLTARFDSQDAERYEVRAMGTGQTVEKTEALDAAWFVTAGKIDPAHSSADHLDVRFSIAAIPMTGPDVVLYVVLTDGRGGVDYAERRLNIVP